MAKRRPVNVKAAVAGAVVAGGALSAAKIGLERVGSREGPRRFSLQAGEPVSGELVRIALGQLDTAIEQLERGSEEAVHEARKSLKRLRAVVRLARDQLGKEVYRRENRELRDLGRRLSGARDSRVLLETLDGIADEPPSGLRESLAAEHALAELQLTGVRESVVRELREVRERVAAWPLEQDRVESLETGFRRIYRRARRAYRRAQCDPTVETLHELRKRSKDVWYCAQILAPVSPKPMKKLSRRAHRLSNLIGEEHDLAILAERVADGQPLARLIARRRKKLVTDALGLGQRTYKKKPRKVVKLLRHRVP